MGDRGRGARGRICRPRKRRVHHCSDPAGARVRSPGTDRHHGVAESGRIAQLVRAPALHAGCRGFESLFAHRITRGGRRAAAPEIFIQNYRGRGGIIGDFLYCVKTREKPFRDIELGHRTATVAHLGNIAYWLGRPIKWNPDKEEIIGDDEAARWLSRPMRAPWTL